MQKITAFKTCDGQTFERSEDARAHEARLKFMENLSKILASSIRTGRVDSVIRHIAECPSEVAEAITSYRKSLPRIKKEEQKLAA
jgi:hypothetical protein